LFQTEPILWLQSFASPALTLLLSAVSLAGSSVVYILAGLVLALADRMRAGLAVLAALLLSMAAYGGLKAGLALPRPDAVDRRVVSAAMAHAAVERGGARGFWSLPPAAAIAAVRARSRDSYGFPSGHVATATAFCFGLAWFLRSKKALAIAVVWVSTVALSRMYLGRHFLGDVLGGLIVGALAVAVVACGIAQSHRLRLWLYPSG
jgi:membrane-associated phospholipid phosphatase